MKVKVTEYNIHNGSIRWEKSYDTFLVIFLTVSDILMF